MSIFKPCDIRGQVDTELTAPMFEAWGRALGRRLAPGAKFVVGGDVRESTPPLMAALVDGLCDSGLDVVELGLLPTPMIHYAKLRLDAAGCAIVTASHNPAQINGLKWMLGDRPPTSEEVAEMALALGPESDRAGQGRGARENGPHPNPLPKGEGTVSRTNSLPKGEGAVSRTRSAPRALDVSFDYVAHLQETFVDSLGARLRVAVDPMHGCWSERARRYLHAVFPLCIFTTVRDSSDGRFGGLAPDCSRQENLRELCDAVYRHRAHLGVAFDGDGDRLALVDDEGASLNPEEAVFVTLESFGDDLAGERFVHDLKYSDRVAEHARRLGAEPVAERSGHAFLRTRMRQCDARLGAEASGHYFFRELDGGEDALYAACRLIAWLARSGRKLSAVRRGCPTTYMTPDLRVPMDDERREEIIDRLAADWADFPQLKTDGVRIDTPGGWMLVRNSVTEPALTFRFEGLDWHALDDLVDRCRAALPDKIGDELWGRYRAAMGGFDFQD
ncbi:MAG: hypothetical protein JW959_10325 [Pirellulales bacterium]|nr:hypothetical protein [Pirellulales bacterium]